MDNNIEFFDLNYIRRLLDEMERDNVYNMNNKELSQYFNYSPTTNSAVNEVYNVYVEGLGNVELKASQYFFPTKERVTQLLNTNVIDFSKSKIFYCAKKLVEESKGVKDLKELRNKQEEILDKYLNEFGKVELDLMLNKLDNAKQFSEWWADDSVNLIKYTTMRDNRVRPSHSQLEGVTLPKTDTFWAKYTPPLEWNCRCKLVTVDGGETKRPKQKDLDITESEVHKEIRMSTIHMLREGSTRSLIGDSHPYMALYNRYYDKYM